MQAFVLDTSALVCLLEEEEGSEAVVEMLRRSEAALAQVFIPFMALMELHYIVWRRKGKAIAEETLAKTKRLPAHRADFSESIMHTAGELKATLRLSVTDAWIAATALDLGARLVHKDPEFEQLAARVELVSLPYAATT